MNAPLQGYYVNEGGKVCSITTPPPAGCHFSFHAKPTFNEVLIVDTKFREILEKYALHPSLEALAAAGVDVSEFKAISSAR